MHRRIVCFACILILAVMLNSCTGFRPRSVESEANAAAILTIHSYGGDEGALFLLPNFGHSFLSVKNLTDSSLKIGSFTLEAHEEMTVGTWGASGHSGVWYNLEAVYYEIDRYNTAITLSKQISIESVQNLTAHILENDRWQFFYNCSAFSIDGWNSVSMNDKIAKPFLPTPDYLRREIKNFTSYDGAKPLANYGIVGHALGDGIIEYQIQEDYII